MANTMRAHYFHLIWSTKNHEPSISSDLQMRLYGHMRTILEKKKTKLFEIGGTSVHVHFLLIKHHIDQDTRFYLG